MKRKWIIIILITCLFFFVNKKDSVENSINLENVDDYILKNISVISMTGEEDVYEASLHIKDGKIYNIYKSNKNLPKDVISLNMKGKYLIPGLSDMHVHANSAKTNTEFLAYGVTLVRVMAGSEVHLIRRDSIKNKSILGPEMYVATMLLDGPEPYWPTISSVLEKVEDVRPLISDLYEKEYDFIKIYSDLSKEVFDEIMLVASEYGLTVAGHVPESIDASYASFMGLLSSEHLLGHLVGERNPKKVNEEVEEIVKNKMWICPTPYVYNLKYSDSSYLNGVDYWEVLSYIRIFNEEGGLIVSGTDESNAFAPAGISLHRTLEMMIEADMTPYEVLETATVNPAIMLNISHRLGTIDLGKDADCVILNENPLVNIKNTQNIYGVITKGRYLDSKWIKKQIKH